MAETSDNPGIFTDLQISRAIVYSLKHWGSLWAFCRLIDCRVWAHCYLRNCIYRSPTRLYCRVLYFLVRRQHPSSVGIFWYRRDVTFPENTWNVACNALFDKYRWILSESLDVLSTDVAEKLLCFRPDLSVSNIGGRQIHAITEAPIVLTYMY